NRFIKSPTLFAESKNLSNENIFGMIQIKDMLAGGATNELQYFTRPPTKLDFLGKGHNAYAFYVDPKNPNHYEFWHVERGFDVPLLTKIPINKKNASYLSFMCFGATGGARPQKDLYLSVYSQRYKEYCEWYEMGQALASQQESDSPRAIITLSDALSMSVPNLILSHFPPCKHLMDEWAYYEAYSDLTRVLTITPRTKKNILLLDRCQKIQHHLEVIGKDYYQAYVDSKGLVPQAKRQKILKMLTELIKDNQSPQALHYLRTRHRVYFEPLQEDHLDQYEPSSFIWDHNKALYYIDEHKKLVTIPPTRAILQKFSSMAKHSETGESYISARDVYYVISRPSFAYFIWENLTYYPSWWRSDRDEYFHTGTAQEMLYEIHDMKLSWRAALYQIFKIIFLVAIPAILASVGLWIPMGWLALKGASLLIFNWTMMVWNIEFTYRCLRSIGYTILHPELKQLDSMLQTLDEDYHHIQDLEEKIDDSAFDESSLLLFP
ncbi:MAG TPA: hypothetical protein VHD33_05440, partial [Legionellaceae bacterium]|nr:hypothetical protein [Legionellaceae bacterium]